MPTRHVTVTDQQFTFLDHLVTEGRYPNASEAIRAALRLLERDEANWDHLKSGVLHGYDQLLHGMLANGTGEEAIARAFGRAVDRTGT